MVSRWLRLIVLLLSRLMLAVLLASVIFVAIVVASVGLLTAACAGGFVMVVIVVVDVIFIAVVVGGEQRLFVCVFVVLSISIVISKTFVVYFFWNGCDSLCCTRCPSCVQHN